MGAHICRGAHVSVSGHICLFVLEAPLCLGHTIRAFTRVHVLLRDIHPEAGGLVHLRTSALRAARSVGIATQERSSTRGYLLKGSVIPVGPPTLRETLSISDTQPPAWRLGYSLGTRSWTHTDALRAFIPAPSRAPGLLGSCPRAHCVPDPPPPGPQSPRCSKYEIRKPHSFASAFILTNHKPLVQKQRGIHVYRL